MLEQLVRHRWLCFVQGGLTLLLGLLLLYLRWLGGLQAADEVIALAGVLTCGFVVLVASLLDLAVAFDSAALRRQRRGALPWLLMGAAGAIVGLLVVLAPQGSYRLVAGLAAAHAALVTAFALSALPELRGNAAERRTDLTLSIATLIFAAGLAFSANGSEAESARAVGAYAVFFGLELIFLGLRVSTLRGHAFAEKQSERHATS